MLHELNFLNVQWGLRSLEDLINVHPLFVHFPIGLLLTAIAFYFLGSILKKNELLVAGKWTLYFGSLAAAATVWTGHLAAETISHGETVHEVMMTHQYLGFAVLGLSLALSAWIFFSKANIPTQGRIYFLIGLALLGLILIQGADLGGRMAFLEGVGVGRKSMIQQAAVSSHHHEHTH